MVEMKLNSTWARVVHMCIKQKNSPVDPGGKPHSARVTQERTLRYGNTGMAHAKFGSHLLTKAFGHSIHVMLYPSWI